MPKQDHEPAKHYKRKTHTLVTAVQIKLDTQGLTYHKWGGQQQAQADDWLVDNDGDCYTVTDSSFSKTYREESPGRYAKHTIIKAKKACTSGSVATQEGNTAYSAGDYLVYNSDDESDTYAISEKKFHELYELADDAR